MKQIEGPTNNLLTQPIGTKAFWRGTEFRIIKGTQLNTRMFEVTDPLHGRMRLYKKGHAYGSFTVRQWSVLFDSNMVECKPYAYSDQIDHLYGLPASDKDGKVVMHVAKSRNTNNQGFHVDFNPEIQ